jgi:predicted SAM-dependent methyltransferase
MDFEDVAKYALRQPRKYLRVVTAKRIVIGSSGTNCEGWLSTDKSFLDVTERSNFARYWRPDSIHAFLAEHVWEHLTIEEAERANRNCFEFLKVSGRLRIAVPDGLNPDKSYIESVKVGGTGPAAYDHKILYDHRSMKSALEKAGFKVELLEYWNEDGKFIAREIDPAYGYISRSSLNDSRNKEGALRYTSLIVDAIKL